MNRELKKYRFILWITIVSFLLPASALLAIPVVANLPDEAQKPATITIAALFWLGIILGIVMIIYANSRMRRMRWKAYATGKLDRPPAPGAFMFSRKAGHLILYGILIVGGAVLISDLILRWLPEGILFFILSGTLIAFVIHSIIDGKNYKAYKIMKEGTHNGYRNKNENN